MATTDREIETRSQNPHSVRAGWGLRRGDVMHMHRLQWVEERVDGTLVRQEGKLTGWMSPPNATAEAHEIERISLVSSASQRFETRTLRTVQTLEEP